jgi:ribosomal-protein-alanine N-acetyltransferase
LITTVPVAYSQEAGEAFVRRQWNRASTGGGYPFVIVRDDQPIGAIGLWPKDAGQGRASLGYWVVTAARGKGAAASALRAITTWGLSELRIPASSSISSRGTPRRSARLKASDSNPKACSAAGSR